MKHNLFWDLVRKDLVLYRGMIIATLGVGVLAVYMMTRGSLMFYLGSVAALCAFIIQTIFLVQFGILTERKERVHYFVLSLPITGWQYMLAKLIALSVAFFLPYLLTSGAALFLIGQYPPSRGFLPFATAILLYFPMYFAVLVSVTAISKNDGPNIATIIFFNIAINLLIPGLMRIPSVAATIEGTVAVWPTELLSVIAIEFGVGVAAIAVMLWHQHNKTEYV